MPDLVDVNVTIRIEGVPEYAATVERLVAALIAAGLTPEEVQAVLDE